MAIDPQCQLSILWIRLRRTDKLTMPRRLQPLPISREHQQSHPRRRLLRARLGYPGRATKDQTTGHCQPSTAAPPAGRLTSPHRCARASLNLPGPLSQKLLTTDNHETTDVIAKHIGK